MSERMISFPVDLGGPLLKYQTPWRNPHIWTLFLRYKSRPENQCQNHPKIQLNVYDAQTLLKRLYCILVGTVITAQIVNTILSSGDEKNGKKWTK